MHPVNKDVAKLTPSQVWSLFAQMATIPRPSKDEDAIRQWVIDLATQAKIPHKLDEVGNLLLMVPGTKGLKKAAPLLLQGHLDMVTEANPGIDHDFTKDPLALRITEDEGRQTVRATGTTLGADNGMGVCLMLAAALDPKVAHGPLEILLTIDEEMGMTGADALKPGFFKSRRMVNLDSEEDTALYIGCAGGLDTTLRMKAFPEKTPAGYEHATVKISGLKGGHSGGDIHLNLGNAIKTLARVLQGAEIKDFRLASIDGGNKRNAIPRLAEATLSGPAGTLESLKKSAHRVQNEVREESHEDNICITVESGDYEGPVLQNRDSQALLQTLMALPSGVMGMHPKMPTLVQTSTNLSTLKTSSDGLMFVAEIGLLSRGSTHSLLMAVANQVASVGHLAGMTVEQYGEYPGWEPNPDSPLLETCRTLYQETFDREPEVLAIHAGLECGIISDRVGGMDAISFGPDIRGAHSPDERVYVDSVEKIWTFLKALLTQLAQ